MYVWCKLVPDATILLYFWPVQSKNLPWVLLAFSIITGGDPFTDLIGIAAGHSYIWLKHVIPQSHGYNFLATPRWAHDLVKYLEEWSRKPSNPNGFLGKWGQKISAFLGLGGTQLGGGGPNRLNLGGQRQNE